MATGFGTFLLRQFFLKIPRELHDAAEIDGCSSWRFLWTIVIPLARPALGTLAVYSFLQTYNQYLWPLLITNDQSMRTVQIGLTLLQDEEHLEVECGGGWSGDHLDSDLSPVYFQQQTINPWFDRRGC